jgi:type II secretory pathway pseudopilin PulG
MKMAKKSTDGYNHGVKRLSRTRGVAMVELAMVMLLITLLGITIFTLIVSGADTQSRIMQEKEAQADARIALSYINVRLRQNDSMGKINIETVDFTGQNGILIRERNLNYEFDTWVYSYNGKLYECLTLPDQQPEESLSFAVIEIEGLDVVWNEDNSVTSTVYYHYRGELRSLSSTVFLRSARRDDDDFLFFW